jgi:hypothetical protein
MKNNPHGRDMSWTPAQQAAATTTMMNYIAQVNQQFEAWIQALQSGTQDQSKAALEETLRQWRASIQQLRATSDSLTMSEGELEQLNTLIREVVDLQSVLNKLRSEAGTRADQANSVNPKVRASPYTNLLGLQRTFRPSARTGLLITTIVLAVLALAILGFIVYRVVAKGSAAAPASYVAVGQTGGGGR